MTLLHPKGEISTVTVPVSESGVGIGEEIRFGTGFLNRNRVSESSIGIGITCWKRVSESVSASESEPDSGIGYHVTVSGIENRNQVSESGIRIGNWIGILYRNRVSESCFGIGCRNRNRVWESKSESGVGIGSGIGVGIDSGIGIGYGIGIECRNWWRNPNQDRILEPESGIGIGYGNRVSVSESSIGI